MIDKPLVSIVVPFFNEEESIGEFYTVLTAVMGREERVQFEVVCVDDGSEDDTFKKLETLVKRDSRIRVVALSRNFGKEAALTAGLDAARGAAVIPLDADLQDPPELIPQMITAWLEGSEVVLGQRIDRSSDSFFKRKTAEIFYRLNNSISACPLPENVGDFRLMDRSVIEALHLLPERQRFMKGLFAWVGFKSRTLEFTRKPREQGKTKLSPFKLTSLALDGMASFSNFPLKIWIYLGGIGALIACSYAVYIILRVLIYGIELPGYASLLVAILFLGSLQLISTGVVGWYVGKIFTEVKQRPLYIVKTRCEAKNES